MSERRGIYRFLRHPKVYDVLQWVIRAPASYQGFVDRHVRPFEGMRVLDIGCGTATILSYLPSVAYVGTDVNALCIERASKRFGARATFIESDGAGRVEAPDQSVDVVLALGVLHHMSDAVAENILEEAARVLVPEGRFVSHDPVIPENGFPMARLFVGMDRGKHVRRRESLLAIVRRYFMDIESFVVSDSLRIPFHEIILECSVARNSANIAKVTGHCAAHNV